MMQNAKDVYNPKFGGVSIEFEVVDKQDSYKLLIFRKFLFAKKMRRDEDG